MPTQVDSCTSSADTIASDGKAIITALVTDGTNPSPDVQVTWVVSSGPGELNPLTSQTGADGTATTELTATGSGGITVTATTDDDTTGKNIVVTAGTSLVDSCMSDPTLVPSDGTLPSKITAVVHDEAGQPVSGVTVIWTVSGIGSGAGTVEPTSSPTDATGSATTELKVTAGPAVMVKATTDADTIGKSTVVSAPETLAALRITNAEDDQKLDHYDIAFGVEAIIPSYRDAAVGDLVVFHWGQNITREFEVTSIDDLPRVINFKTDLPPDALDDGEYDAYYVVTDLSGNLRPSSNKTVTVEDGGQTPTSLPQPTAEEDVNDDGFLNMIEVANGVHVTGTYPSIAEGDKVTVYWKATVNDIALTEATTSVPHIVGTSETAFRVVIDASYFYPFNNGYEGNAEVYYTVTPADGSPLKLSVSNHYRVDTVAPKHSK